jgi:lipid II:glycine glycyltransferase (peptidoglycan interpeptide bridge formation enzyme)
MPYCPGYSRLTGNRSVAVLIQKAQDKLFEYDNQYTHWVGTGNQGWPPYLVTVASTYQYDVADAYTDQWFGVPYYYAYSDPYGICTNRREIADVLVESWPALENTNAGVRFKKDPGASTQQYFVDFTWEPMRLTSESIPLCVPADYEEALEDYVIGKIQTRETGKISDRLAMFNSYWLPRWQQDMSQDAHTQVNQTRPRVC